MFMQEMTLQVFICSFSCLCFFLLFLFTALLNLDVRYTIDLRSHCFDCYHCKLAVVGQVNSAAVFISKNFLQVVTSMLLKNLLLMEAVNFQWPAEPLAMPVKPEMENVPFYWVCSESICMSRE